MTLDDRLRNWAWYVSGSVIPQHRLRRRHRHQLQIFHSVLVELIEFRHSLMNQVMLITSIVMETNNLYIYQETDKFSSVHVKILLSTVEH